METKPQKSFTEAKQAPENFIKDVRRKARKIYSSEQKILIVMEALRGEDSVAASCRRHAIAESMFYWVERQRSWKRERSDWLVIPQEKPLLM
jgi:hypothetical protein